MKALIMCNGEAPSEKLLQNEVNNADLIVGADGGGNILFNLGVTPDAIVGDLDSFYSFDESSVEVINISDQETNDLEKALNYVLSKGARKCVILGAFGKRIDHSLKNLSVLHSFQEEFEQIYFRDDYQDVLLITSPYRNSFPVGTTISIIPFAGEIRLIKTKGLKYPLKEESLKIGVRDGTSNITEAEEIEITFEKGHLLLTVVNDTEL